jgi:hypothetical protein
VSKLRLGKRPTVVDINLAAGKLYLAMDAGFLPAKKPGPRDVVAMVVLMDCVDVIGFDKEKGHSKEELIALLEQRVRDALGAGFVRDFAVDRLKELYGARDEEELLRLVEQRPPSPRRRKRRRAV